MLTSKELIARNNIQISGDGDRVLLFGHGFGCDQNTWRAIVPAFNEGFKIVVFDYVGAGKSDLSAYNESRYSSLKGYALDVIEICEVLDLRNVIFVGHSVSSMMGCLLSKKICQDLKK